MRVDAVQVKTRQDLLNLDGLILPGGESTTIMMMAERSLLVDDLRSLILSGFPVWGICAGCILLAAEATHAKIGGQTLLGGLDICVDRNAFGGAKNSFIQDIDFDGVGNFPGVFIRFD